MEGVRLEGVQDAESAYFAEAMEIYRTSFPENELRPVPLTAAMVGQNDRYTMTCAVSDKVFGFALSYHGDGFSLLDYMAVLPGYRRRGIGGMLLDSCRLDHEPVLLEVQKVQAGPDRGTREDRARFYTGRGAKVLLESYSMPSFGVEAELMSLMALLPPGSAVTRGALAGWVSEIYDHVYGRSDIDVASVNPGLAGSEGDVLALADGVPSD